VHGHVLCVGERVELHRRTPAAADASVTISEQ
jgi:hypothetical protein